MMSARRSSLAAALAVCLSGLAWQPGAAQQPARPPAVAFDVDVPLVEVDAVVTDADGRVIRDLRAEDFEVLEDGRPQTIDRVQFVEIPITSAAARPAAPATGVRTNQQRFDGRLYVLLLDDVQTAAARAVRVRTAARAFVETRLEPGDLAAVMHVSGPGPGQDFTADRARLLASIDRFVGRKVGSETLNLIDEYNRSVLSTGRIPEAGRVRDPEEQARADDARRAFGAITRIAERLGAVRGRRKALLWFGEGVGYDMFDTARRSQAFTVFESARSAAAAASRANLVIYGMDARGLGGLGEETMQMSSPDPDPTTDRNARGLGRELVRSQDNLRQVSADTGGFAVVNSDEFGRAYERVVEESSAYYLLGYYPAEVKDGAFRKLEVRVTRPGASVRARRGYIFTRSPAAAKRGGARASVEDALRSPVPLSGLPMALHAMPFRGDGKKSSVLVTVEFGAAAFTALDAIGPDAARLEATVVAVDPGGAVAATDSNTIDLRVKEQTRRAMEVVGFRVLSRLDLPPGRYQVRAAGLLAATGAVGSVHFDLDVPDFGASGLSISGLAVTSVVAGYTPTGRLDDRMRAVLPAPPTASRDFRQDEAVALFAEVYEGGRVPRQPVTFRAEVRDQGGRVVLEREETRSAGQLDDAKGGFSLQIPLRDLAPAEYALRLDARAGGPAVVSDDVRFAVWAVPAPEPAGRIVSVAKGSVSGVGEPRQETVRTPAEWARVWGALGLRGAAPPVAFDSTMVVAIFLGARPTAGYEIEVIGSRRDGDTLVVEWRERVPEPGNPPASTTPFAIAGLPLHTGPVAFVQR
jgi:VWFA-related protein